MQPVTGSPIERLAFNSYAERGIHARFPTKRTAFAVTGSKRRDHCEKPLMVNQGIGQESSIIAHEGEPAEIGVPNLQVMGDPNSPLELAVLWPT